MRALAFLLLDDDYGITRKAWRILYDMLIESGEYYDDIINSVRETEGRCYLASYSAKHNDSMLSYSENTIT